MKQISSKFTLSTQSNEFVPDICTFGLYLRRLAVVMFALLTDTYFCLRQVDQAPAASCSADISGGEV